MEDSTKTYEYRLKCMNCSLHYAVFSWEHWTDKHEKGGYCPECGIRGNKIVYGPVEREEFIFQLVPGEASMQAITPVERVAPFGIGSMALPEDE